MGGGFLIGSAAGSASLYCFSFVGWRASQWRWVVSIGYTPATTTLTTLDARATTVGVRNDLFGGMVPAGEILDVGASFSRPTPCM